MKFDKDIAVFAKDVSRVSVILCIVEIAVSVVLSVTGLFPFRIGYILGSAGGTAVAILCFYWMAAQLQKALDQAQVVGTQVNRGVQAGYNKRLLLQGVWILLAIFVPFINVICGVIPLLFPKLSILILQKTGKLNLTQSAGDPKGGEK